MTDRPYTDDDLRAEAARQHSARLAEKLDVLDMGEQMDGAPIESTGRPWGQLDDDAWDDAQQEVYGLIAGAADVSHWAINLGADGLEPDGRTLQLGVDPGDGDRRRVRLHFAFHPDMDIAARDHFVMELSKAIAAAL